MRGVYVARVNHLGVISWPLAPTDITAITRRCTNAVFRPSALTGTARSQCSPMQSHGRWHLLALQSEHANLRVSFSKHNKLTTTNEDYVIDEGVDKKSDLVYFMIITK